MARVRFQVVAHHNVEDFRPYKILFEDRGDEKANIAQAMFLAIKREGKWEGWFESPCGDLGEGRDREIKEAIDRAIASGKEQFVQGVEVNDDGDDMIPAEHGLVIWVEFDSKYPNFGFGIGRPKSDGTYITDKYDNKWVQEV